ncbi:MAG: hypothetical protein LAO78_25695 [Acidobacteriia bacterium]|nr:hypothetical protein [Terriglobia bacterium]
MSDQEKDKQMDAMLDSLLTAYSSVEPRPGLETRILANLRDAERREAKPAAWNFKWLWAGMAVAAAIIIAVVLIGGRHRVVAPPTVVQKQQPAPPQPEVQRSAPVTAVNVPRPRAPRATQVQNVNATLALNQRPQVFPTPTPLSEQERLLLRYYAGTPREEVVAQSHPDEPPVITEDQTEAIPDLTHIPQKLSNTQ